MRQPPDPNLRHLAAFAEVCRLGSLTRAAEVVFLSQPALSQALARLEAQAGAALVVRGRRGLTPTPAGEILRFRAERAFAVLDAGVTDACRRARVPRPARLALTAAQLRALAAIEAGRSYSAGARGLGLAQPSVYRAAREVEAALGFAPFEKTAEGLAPTRAAVPLLRAGRLMFAELDQGFAEIAHLQGTGAEGLRIGALPLARATLLPPAIEAMGAGTGAPRFDVIDGPYGDLVHALRIGEIDLLLGALRSPPPYPDLVQEVLFRDRLGVFCGPGHPLLRARPPLEGRLGEFPWALPRPETPTRQVFDAAFPEIARGHGLVETGSMLVVRGLLQSGRRLTVMSRHQVAAEVAAGLMFELPVRLDDPPRDIGLVRREGWVPTPVQERFLDVLRAVGAPLGAQAS